METKKGTRLSFLDVMVTRKPDETLAKRCIENQPIRTVTSIVDLIISLAKKEE